MTAAARGSRPRRRAAAGSDARPKDCAGGAAVTLLSRAMAAEADAEVACDVLVDFPRSAGQLSSLSAPPARCSARCTCKVSAGRPRAARPPSEAVVRSLRADASPRWRRAPAHSTRRSRRSRRTGLRAAPRRRRRRRQRARRCSRLPSRPRPTRSLLSCSRRRRRRRRRRRPPAAAAGTQTTRAPSPTPAPPPPSLSEAAVQTDSLFMEMWRAPPTARPRRAAPAPAPSPEEEAAAEAAEPAAEERRPSAAEMASAAIAKAAEAAAPAAHRRR